jgi:hypothetical protein
MAVALVLDFPEGTMEQYHEVVRRMELDGQMAPGGIFHAAGIYEGSLRVVDAWEDAEQFQRFSDEQIVPLTQAVGLAPPKVRMLDVDETKPAGGGTPAFVQIVTLPGLDRDSFRAADAKVLGDDPAPAEATFHVNGPTEGGWMVIDAWTSKEARDRFAESNIRPGMADAPLSAPPVFEDLAVEATLGDRTTAPQA